MKHPVLISFLAAGSILALAACTTTEAGSATVPAAGSAEELTGTVSLLLPNTTTTRYVEHDTPAFVDAMGELAPNVKVEVLNAEGNAAKQLTQAETGISQGSLALVTVTADPLMSGSVLQKAADAGVPVIGYEHEALDGPLTYQVMFDPYKVGQAQGTYFAGHLPEAGEPIRIARIYGNQGDNYTSQVKKGQDESIEKLVSEGRVEVVCEDYAAGWDPANAQRLIEQCLTKTQSKVDAVIASNDGTASGVIAALESQDLTGSVPVYGGQDANLEALRYILQGKQQDTVFKNYAAEGKAAAELTVAALLGQEPREELVNATYNNNVVEVPAAFLPVESINKDNIATVVDAGLYTKEELCDGLTGVDYCES
jgi:D-xylose transport system substrate-binding protein